MYPFKVILSRALDGNRTCARFYFVCYSVSYRTSPSKLESLTIRVHLGTLVQLPYNWVTFLIVRTRNKRIRVSELASDTDSSPNSCPCRFISGRNTFVFCVGLEFCFFQERFNGVFKAFELVVLKINDQSVVYSARHCFFFAYFGAIGDYFEHLKPFSMTSVFSGVFSRSPGVHDGHFISLRCSQR